MSTKKAEVKATKLSYEQFIRKAIVSLRREGYKGIHVVYSGFNEAFKKYFDGIDPKTVISNLGDKFKTMPVRGGVMLYLAEEAPEYTTASGKADKALTAILG